MSDTDAVLLGLLALGCLGFAGAWWLAKRRASGKVSSNVCAVGSSAWAPLPPVDERPLDWDEWLGEEPCTWPLSALIEGEER